VIDLQRKALCIGLLVCSALMWVAVSVHRAAADTSSCSAEVNNPPPCPPPWPKQFKSTHNYGYWKSCKATQGAGVQVNVACYLKVTATGCSKTWSQPDSHWFPPNETDTWANSKVIDESWGGTGCSGTLNVVAETHITATGYPFGPCQGTPLAPCDSVSDPVQCEL
jgi:hypothetical protein